MTGKKRYLQPKDMILNAVHDLAELQKARTVLCDSSRGMIGLLVTMYAVEWEYRFTVEDAGGNRSLVNIELLGGEADGRRLIDHEFALLDYVLVDRTRIEIIDAEVAS